jgi:PPOX class probable F420-dependent enzyme
MLAAGGGRDAQGHSPVSGPAPGPYGDGVNRRGQIQMSPDEIRAFLDESRNMTMCTFNHDGTIHAVAMWFGFLGGAIAIQTKSKSQKARNLRRDGRTTCLVEAGKDYNELRGVELVGWAELVEDPDELFEIGVSVFDRHVAAYSEELRPQVELMLRNRVGAKLHVERTVSWDHRKLSG